MRRVLLNFQEYAGAWSVHFIEADCRSLIGPRTQYFNFATLDDLRAFVKRCHPDDMAEFESSAQAWSRGSNYVMPADEQYAKLNGTS